MSKFYYPTSIAEAGHLYHQEPDALLYAGGTSITRMQQNHGFQFPESVINLASIAELKNIQKRERFIDLGSCVTLNQILNLRGSAMPELLTQSLSSIANYSVRNLATLGGNIAQKFRFNDGWVALACLDAVIEAYDGRKLVSFNINRLVDEEERPAPLPFIYTKVKIPLIAWDMMIFKKIGRKDSPNADSASFAIAIRLERNIIMDCNIIFAGEFLLRARDLETRITGQRLPLSQEFQKVIAYEYYKLATNFSPMLQKIFYALVDNALGELTH